MYRLSIIIIIVTWNNRKNITVMDLGPFLFFSKGLHTFPVFATWSISMPLHPLPFPNDGKTNMILFYIVNRSRSSSLKSIGSGCHFFCLLVIPLRFQVITRTKQFEGNGTSQKEHDICTAKQTLYIYISKDKYEQKLFWYYYSIEPYKFYFDFD